MNAYLLMPDGRVLIPRSWAALLWPRTASREMPGCCDVMAVSTTLQVDEAHVVSTRTPGWARKKVPARDSAIGLPLNALPKRKVTSWGGLCAWPDCLTFTVCAIIPEGLGRS